MAIVALFMIKWGVAAACETTWNNSIAEFPGLSVGRDLHADPGRGPGDAALRDRAPLVRRSAADVASPFRDQPQIDCESHDGRPHPAGRVPRSSCSSACRWPTRWAWRRSSPRCGSTCRSKRSCSRSPTGMDDFALLTIPFFVLAGAIMSEGGVARRLVDLAKVFVGFIRGGLALVNVLASTLLRLPLGLVGRRHRLDRLGDDPADGEERLLRASSPPTSPSAARCRRSSSRPRTTRSSTRSPPAARSRSRALFMAGVFPGLLFGACLDRAGA